MELIGSFFAHLLINYDWQTVFSDDFSLPSLIFNYDNVLVRSRASTTVGFCFYCSINFYFIVNFSWRKQIFGIIGSVSRRTIANDIPKTYWEEDAMLLQISKISNCSNFHQKNQENRNSIKAKLDLRQANRHPPCSEQKPRYKL